MIAIEQARGADLADTEQRLGARLRRVGANEWAGPCPACGGADRFSVNTKRRVFNCRSFRGGDVITMVEHALGLDFAGALESIPGEEGYAARREPPSKPAIAIDNEKRRIERTREIWRASVDPRG